MNRKMLTSKEIDKISNLKEVIEKDKKDRLTLRGKYAPETGVCVVCAGKVVGCIRQKLTNRIGGPPPVSYVDGWYCEDCGLTYHHLPKKIDKK